MSDEDPVFNRTLRALKSHPNARHDDDEDENGDDEGSDDNEDGVNYSDDDGYDDLEYDGDDHPRGLFNVP